MVADVHRSSPPIFFVADGYPGGTPAWVVRRAADLRRIYSNTEHFSVKGFSPLARMIGESWDLVPAEIDPPRHGQFRTLLNPLFTPVALKKLEGKVADVARKLAEGLKGEKTVDFRAAFAVPFPVSIALDLLGLPLSRMDEFMRWEHGMLHDANVQNMMQATRNVVGLLREVIKERRSNPGDDLVSFALSCKIEDRLLSDDEL